VADAQGEFETLVAKWRAEDIEVLPAVPEEQLLALESRFRLRLPKAFRAYLGLAGGMGRGWDEGLIHFWTLDEIARHLGEPGSLERWPFLPASDSRMPPVKESPGSASLAPCYRFWREDRTSVESG
jgi:hypothetical protein